MPSLLNALPFDIVIYSNAPTYCQLHLVLPIVTVIHPVVDYTDGVVPRPDFPASEPVAGDIYSSFGKRL